MKDWEKKRLKIKMNCKCGKEIGIRLFCEECLADLNREIDGVRDCLAKATKKFEEGIKDISKDSIISELPHSISEDKVYEFNCPVCKEGSTRIVMR